jgi:hypothetical protein
LEFFKRLLRDEKRSTDRIRAVEEHGLNDAAGPQLVSRQTRRWLVPAAAADFPFHSASRVYLEV